MIIWLPEALAVADVAFSPDHINVSERVFQYFFTQRDARFYTQIFLYATFDLTIVNALLDPLIFAMRTKIIKEAIRDPLTRCFSTVCFARARLLPDKHAAISSVTTLESNFQESHQNAVQSNPQI